MKVYVYTKCDEVRLELNGKILETQKAKQDSKFTFIFNVPYESGELKAVALTDGKEVAIKSIKTTGSVEKVKIIPDRPEITADRNDLAYLTIELVDKNGSMVPNAETNVRFSVDGEAEIAAVGNGNPREPKSFQSDNCNTFHGRCLVILRPTGKPGKVTLTAQSGDIFSEKCEIEIK
jgi:beta-galactosidase